MSTSLTTTNNAFRYPAGLVGEAPDVPDDIRKLATDLDGFITLGNWFPTLGGTGASTGTSGGSDGTYLRIGKRIIAEGRIIFGTSGATFGTGNPVISGLPASIDANHSSGHGWFGATSGGLTLPLAFIPLDASNMLIRVHQSTAAGSPVSLVNANTLAAPPQSSSIRFSLSLTLA